MLKFWVVNMLMVCLLAIITAGHIWYGVPFYVYAIVALCYCSILFYGCYYIGSGFFIKVICAAATHEKIIAISFDDGPSAYTPQFLQVLNEHRVKATFFCIGKNIKGNEPVLSAISRQGHLIGNHSFSHDFWFDLLSPKKMKADLQAADEAILAVSGRRPKLFRPPYGVTNPTVKKVIMEGGYIPVGWNVRSMDTVNKDEQKLLRKVVSRIKPGAIFLFHDTSPVTLSIIPQFIKQVKDNGYQIVPLDKMLNLQPYA
jgi:peptidoglycan/xylan/chitin deacetylase (PgdA/CDA1 family)